MSREERMLWCRNEYHKLNHKSSKGLVHFLWKLKGVFYYSETKWNPTHSSWMAARDRGAQMRLNHDSKYLREGRSQSLSKFGVVSILSQSLRMGFGVVIPEFRL